MSASALSTEVMLMTPTMSASDLETDLLLLIPSMSIGDLTTESIAYSSTVNGEEILAGQVTGELRAGATVIGEY